MAAYPSFMSFYISGPPVPTVYAKPPPQNRAPRIAQDRDQALLSHIGRLSNQRGPDATSAESIRSGRAGSIASSNFTSGTGGSGGSFGVMSPTSSFSAGAASSSMVQHPGILASNTTFEYADEVLASLRFLMPFVKAGEVDSKAKEKAAHGVGQTDSLSPGKNEGERFDASASSSSSPSGTLTAMESEVYSILKTYVENKLKKKRGGRAKRLVEVGTKVEALEQAFPDCTTYTKLFKRVREAYDLPPIVDQTTSATATTTSTSSFGDSFGPIVTRDSSVSSPPRENGVMDESFNRSLPQFAPPRPTLDRSAVSNPTSTDTNGGPAGPSSPSTLTRQISPTRSISLGSSSGRRLSKPQKPMHHAHSSGGNQHASKPSYSSAESTSSSFLSNITAEDIFVNFGVGDVVKRTAGGEGIGSSSAAVKSSRRPSMAILGSTFNFHSRKRSDGVDDHARQNEDDDEFGWKGQKKREEVEISWPIRDPLGSFAPNTEDQQRAEEVKAKMAEALVNGIDAKVPVRPKRPAGSPLDALGIEAGRSRDETIVDNSTPKAAVRIKKKPSVISDTFEADIFGTSPDRTPLEERRASGGSLQFDRSARRGSVKSLGLSVPPPPSAPLPAIPTDTAGDMSPPLVRSRSNSSSSSAADHAKRQAVFLAATADPVEVLRGTGEVEELQTRDQDDESGSSFGIKSVDEAMAVLQGRSAGMPLVNGNAEPGKTPLASHKHSSWSRASAGRLCDLPEEGEGDESDGESAQAHSKQSLGLDDDMTSPALSTNGQRYSTDSYDLKITTPEGHGSFHAEYTKKFDAGIGAGLDEMDLERELFFRAPTAVAKRDSNVLNSWT